MYLRHSTRRKDGKIATYRQLVRSERRGRKVAQQTAAHLGELDGQGHAQAKALARAIPGERGSPIYSGRGRSSTNQSPCA